MDSIPSHGILDPRHYCSSFCQIVEDLAMTVQEKESAEPASGQLLRLQNDEPNVNGQTSSRTSEGECPSYLSLINTTGTEWEDISGVPVYPFLIRPITTDLKAIMRLPYNRYTIDKLNYHVRQPLSAFRQLLLMIQLLRYNTRHSDILMFFPLEAPAGPFFLRFIREEKEDCRLPDPAKFLLIQPLKPNLVLDVFYLMATTPLQKESLETMEDEPWYQLPKEIQFRNSVPIEVNPNVAVLTRDFIPLTTTSHNEMEMEVLENINLFSTTDLLPLPPSVVFEAEERSQINTEHNIEPYPPLTTSTEVLPAICVNVSLKTKAEPEVESSQSFNTDIKMLSMVINESTRVQVQIATKASCESLSLPDTDVENLITILDNKRFLSNTKEDISVESHPICLITSTGMLPTIRDKTELEAVASTPLLMTGIATLPTVNIENMQIQTIAECEVEPPTPLNTGVQMLSTIIDNGSFNTTTEPEAMGSSPLLITHSEMLPTTVNNENLQIQTLTESEAEQPPPSETSIDVQLINEEIISKMMNIEREVEPIPPPSTGVVGINDSVKIQMKIEREVEPPAFSKTCTEMHPLLSTAVEIHHTICDYRSVKIKSEPGVRSTQQLSSDLEMLPTVINESVQNKVRSECEVEPLQKLNTAIEMQPMICGKRILKIKTEPEVESAPQLGTDLEMLPTVINESVQVQMRAEPDIVVPQLPLNTVVELGPAICDVRSLKIKIEPEAVPSQPLLSSTYLEMIPTVVTESVQTQMKTELEVEPPTPSKAWIEVIQPINKPSIKMEMETKDENVGNIKMELGSSTDSRGQKRSHKIKDVLAKVLFDTDGKVYTTSNTKCYARYPKRLRTPALPYQYSEVGVGIKDLKSSTISKAKKRLPRKIFVDDEKIFIQRRSPYPKRQRNKTIPYQHIDID